MVLSDEPLCCNFSPELISKMNIDARTRACADTVINASTRYYLAPELVLELLYELVQVINFKI